MDSIPLPPVDELWTQYLIERSSCETWRYVNGNVQLVDSATNLREIEHLEKDPFFRGVAKAAEMIQQRVEFVLPVPFDCHGGNPHFVQVARGSGLPKRWQSKWEKMCDYSSSPEVNIGNNPGFSAALRWYASRGIFAAGAIECTRILNEIPNLTWQEISQQESQVCYGGVSARLVQSDEEPNLVLKTGATEMLVRWPRQTAFSVGVDDFHVQGSQWSYHEPSRSLWMRSTSSSISIAKATLQIAPEVSLVISEFISNRTIEEMKEMKDRLLKEIRA